MEDTLIEIDEDPLRSFSQDFELRQEEFRTEFRVNRATADALKEVNPSFAAFKVDYPAASRMPLWDHGLLGDGGLNQKFGRSVDRINGDRNLGFLGSNRDFGFLVFRIDRRRRCDWRSDWIRFTTGALTGR